MNPNHAAAIWRGMIEIKDRGPMDPVSGICRNLMLTSAIRRSDLTSSDLEAILRGFYTSWSSYSGSLRYPVPAPVEGMTASYAYTYFGNKWDVTSDDVCAGYARTRVDLFEHIFKCLYDTLSENLSVLRTS